MPLLLGHTAGRLTFGNGWRLETIEIRPLICAPTPDPLSFSRGSFICEEQQVMVGHIMSMH